MSGIFAPSAVALARAVAAGWANVGSAAAQLVMPLAYELILRLGVPITVAWRVTYLLPCALLIATGLAVLAFPYDDPRAAPASAAEPRPARASRRWCAEGSATTARGCSRSPMATATASCSSWRTCRPTSSGNVSTSPYGGGGRRRGVLRRDERGGAASGRGGIGRGREAVRDAQEAVAALGRAETAGAALCVLVGRMGAAEAPSLAATMAVMVACAAFAQAASGLTFGIVPFVSKR
ncbi:unnamed protein product [Miscanthus lutarioriparius]|uniref:Major facilitator superfamily (MFS) profile domain-containing protein n=1 Tax=Miscanthus lutarioriparius TaxID=422564 RepID=A0A811SJA5_9POAL|nr:unnamed protein product [Miscanthus lutarioriparius]